MGKINTIIGCFFVLIIFLGGNLKAQSSCPDLEEVINVQVYDCNDLADVCLPVKLEEIIANTLTLSVNGEEYAGTYFGCDFDSTIVYSYFTLLGSGEAGPYLLEDWTVNGETFSGEFLTMSDLVDSMNVWDPTGNWVLEAAMTSIFGGDLSNVYGNMLIEQLQLPGSFATLGLNYGQYALGTIIQLPVGTHEIFIENPTENCSDMAIINVICTPTEYITETVYLGLSGQVCLDDSQLLGPISSVSPCSMPLNEDVEFFIDPDNSCITYSGIAEGQETACYVACDEMGICDTTYITVNVVLPPEGEIIIETILVGEAATECLSAEELPGSNFVVMNDCPEDSGTNVQFAFENGSLCIEYEGLSVGMDSACIVICDDTGTCDTTLFFISVINPEIGNPIAVADTSSVPQNATSMIDVVSNDSVDYVTVVSVLMSPANGETYVTSTNEIAYEPNEGYCGDDQLTYLICNSAGCDTASVSITVVCGEVIVYNGFSPNQDGVNDMFRIGGIEAYPNSSVKIFNTWGNLVYQNIDGEGYKNIDGWDGTWNGKNLPDGNYFYIIELNDPDQQKITGYVLVHR